MSTPPTDHPNATVRRPGPAALGRHRRVARKPGVQRTYSKGSTHSSRPPRLAPGATATRTRWSPSPTSRRRQTTAIHRHKPAPPHL